jgi:hypothetical protein
VAAAGLGTGGWLLASSADMVFQHSFKPVDGRTPSFSHWWGMVQDSESRVAETQTTS